ncbi:MAG: NAD(P)H-hydrate dehydratase [Melioribacteraceae bacterium]|nr:NAD(P)H-hydrate dehydratase [Melioribacteraceae bacterium]MCF8353954.1 NAD(P)H-hydrate dehydratase [Melioribacteraceae bacterium]MCF8393682.1 NAD(P)H-hydrate dehydratase [Melioribacteraceae bacterium]MCF8419576.1 NAD(P)H-hydrate dehydratase [Melioribacteraceae bacterium]
MIPLFASEQVRKADQYAIKTLGIPGVVLMENASISIFNSIIEKYPELTALDHVGIVCGKGNNGGDGYAVARHFINAGNNVTIISLAKESELKGDAEINYRITNKLIGKTNKGIIKVYSSLKDLSRLKSCSLIIDAILGTGSTGELRSPYKEIVQKLNDLDADRVAIDLPTGLDVNTGTGDIVFNADLTVTLAELKTGLFYEKGRMNCGEILKGNIGIGDEFFDGLSVSEYLIEPEDAFVGLPKVKKGVHKYSAGKVLTIAGSGSLPGAAILTANSVLKTGAGASILAFPKSIKTLAQSKLDSAVVHPFEDQSKELLVDDNIIELKEKIEWADVIAIGPGLGRNERTLQAVVQILNEFPNKKYVIDADALFALRKGMYKKLKLNNAVFTPHHGEFAEMLGIETKQLKMNILKYGKEFSQQTNSYLVLKGAPTIIFNPKGEVFINTSGNAGMATFGTGDVLTGMISGFIAQSEKLEPALISSVYLHSLSADLLLETITTHGITADKIMYNIPRSIRFLNDSII